MMSPKNPLFVLLISMGIMMGCAPAITPIPQETPTQIIHEPATPVEAGPYTFHIATGSNDSIWHGMGRQIASDIEQELPDVVAIPKETQGVMENLKLLTSGKVEMTFGYDYQVKFANQGKLMSIFPDARPEKLTIKCGVEIIRPAFPDYSQPVRIVLPLYEEYLYIVTTKASGIKTPYDLKDGRISAGEPGSVTEQQARFVFSGTGIDWDKDVIRETLNVEQSILALEEERIDAFFWSGSTPTTEMLRLLTAPDPTLMLLPITGEVAQEIMSIHPGVFHMRSMPTDNNAQPETLAVTVALITMEEFPADQIEQILAFLFNGAPESDSSINTFHVNLDAVTLLLTREDAEYLHNGALDYFTGQGLIR